MTETPLADNPGGAEEAKRGAGRLRPKHAASLILWRDGPEGVEVLMGLRHARHRFMPNMLVFPGGRVDRADHRAPVISELTALARTGLERQAPPSLARAIGVAAARELEEETGLVLGRMEGTRLHADLAPLEYLCRAVTPPNRVARFNARFLIARAEATHGTLRGSGELEELRYFSFADARRHKVATITARVLGQFEAWLALSVAERAARPLVCFRGRDTPSPER